MSLFPVWIAAALAGTGPSVDATLPTLWGARVVEDPSGSASVEFGTNIGVGTVEVGGIVPLPGRNDVRIVVRYRPTVSFFYLSRNAFTVAAPFRFEVHRAARASVAFVGGPEIGVDVEGPSGTLPMFGVEGAVLASWRATPALVAGTFGLHAEWVGEPLPEEDGGILYAHTTVTLNGGVEAHVGHVIVGVRPFVGMVFGPFYERLLNPTAGVALTLGGPSSQ